MSLKTNLEEKVYDVRLRDRNLAYGKLTQSDLESHLTNLPDDEGNVTFTDSGDKKREEAPEPTEA